MLILAETVATKRRQKGEVSSLRRPSLDSVQSYPPEVPHSEETKLHPYPDALPRNTATAHGVGGTPATREGRPRASVELRGSCGSGRDLLGEGLKQPLQGTVVSSLPDYRRMGTIATNDEGAHVIGAISSEAWRRLFCEDARNLVLRCILHACGPSCWTYSKLNVPHLRAAMVCFMC